VLPGLRLPGLPELGWLVLPGLLQPVLPELG
jgi:hypothetical protein